MNGCIEPVDSERGHSPRQLTQLQPSSDEQRASFPTLCATTPPPTFPTPGPRLPTSCSPTTCSIRSSPGLSVTVLPGLEIIWNTRGQSPTSPKTSTQRDNPDPPVWFVLESDSDLRANNGRDLPQLFLLLSVLLASPQTTFSVSNGQHPNVDRSPGNSRRSARCSLVFSGIQKITRRSRHRMTGSSCATSTDRQSGDPPRSLQLALQYVARVVRGPDSKSSIWVLEPAAPDDSVSSAH